MNLQIKFHQIDSTPSLKEMIQHKCEKLHKYFDGHFDVKWTCSTGKEGHHSHVIVACDGFTINADSKMDDLYKTFDDAISKVEKQLSKRKTLMKDKIHSRTDVNEFIEREEEEEDYE